MKSTASVVSGRENTQVSARRVRPIVRALAGLALAAWAVPAAAQAPTVPDGFQATLVAGIPTTGSASASRIVGATAMEFAPDGRLFVCQQTGILRVVKNGSLLATPFMSITVDDSGERGLLGIAFDPNFATNNFLYVYYTVATAPIHNRVSRFTANGDVVVPGSEQVILELDNLSTATNHNGGAIHFGTDGKLYVAVGDNATSANAQSMTTRLGKILRINSDGSIPTNNPFYATASGANRAIWALGLRNPFTMQFRPASTTLYINDVGQDNWEEIDSGVAGANYGWPTTEGEFNPSTFPNFTNPVFAYAHTGSPQACAISGGAFYPTGSINFPAEYEGLYFFTDYCAGFIRTYDPVGDSALDFGAGLASPVDLKVGPDGALYVLQRGVGSGSAPNTGTVYRIDYPSNLVPVITQDPQDTLVTIGADATFTVVATGGQPLTYQWSRDGVDIDQATSASYTLPNAQLSDSGSTFAVHVHNPFGDADSLSATLTVTSNTPPTATILTPTVGTLYSGGETINYSGTGTDAEDGTEPGSRFSWEVVFHHDTHTHPFIQPTTGTSGSFVIPNTGETSANVFYRIQLTVTDADGFPSTTVTRDITPRTANITLATAPAGLQVTLDGQPQTSPITVQSVVGVQRSIGAPSPQTVGQTSYGFASWSDSGAATHTITTPAVDTTYTATFSASAPTLTIVGGVTTVSPGATVQVAVANGPGFTKDWVALHTTAAADNVYLAWNYLNGTHTAPATGLTSATLSFVMPMTAGTYNFRFFQNNTSTKLATSATVTVSAPTNPVLDVNPTSLAFGDVNVGATLDKTVVVKNTGGGTLSGGGSVTGTGYSIIGTATYALAANEQMTMTVRFAPGATGSAPGTLTLTGGAGATVPLTGNGTTGGPSLTIVGGVTTVTPGATVQVQVSNGPGNLKDWVALHTTAAADTSYLAWKYLSGTTTLPPSPLTSATLTFTMPTTLGTYNFRFFANGLYTKLATSPTVTVAAASSPVLNVTPSSLDFGDVAVSSTLDKTVVVKNTGGGTLSGGGSVTGTGYSIIGTSTYSLLANEQMTMTVRFAPTAAGSASGTLTLTGGAGASVPLTGNGTTGGPSLTIVGGVTTVTPGATVQVQVSNGPGNLKDWVALHTTAAADTSYLAWKYLSGTTTLPPSPLTSATLTFTMPTTLGTYNFRFFANGVYTKLATSPTVTVANASSPVLNVTPASLDFGDVAVSSTLDKTVVVKNTGGGTLSGGGSVTGTGYSIIGTSTYSLLANEQMTMTVRFAPTATGSAPGTLTLTGGAGATVPLTGNGTSGGGPSLTIVGGVTTVAPGATVQVQVSNGPGNLKDWVALHTTAAADTSYLAWKYLSGTTTLPPSPLTSATLTFTMPTTLGTYNFRFFANGVYTKLATSPTVTVASASGPVLNVTPASLDFGNVAVSSTLDKTVVVKNTGTGTLTGGGSVTGTGYSIIGTSTYSLLANEQMTMTVRFAPTAGGASSGSLTLTGGAGATVPLTGTGTTGSPTLTIVGGVTTVAPGATVQVQVSNGPGFQKDWVGLHIAANADVYYVAWNYLSGTHTLPPTPLTSATLTFTMPMTPGTYNFRFFQNGGYTKLATSPTLTVQ